MVIHRALLPLALIAVVVVLSTPGVTTDADAGYAPSAKSDPLPNILLILTDDQRAEETLEVMPKTRSWFEQGGTRFSSAFSTTPLCCPGRASIFSGRYAHNHGVRTNGGFTVVQALDQRSTLQRYLREAGYRTALIGKYFYSWNLSVPPPYVDEWALFRGGYSNAWFKTNDTGVRVPYSTEFIAERAVDFLRRTEAQDQQPWFLFVGTQAPHQVPTPQPDYAAAPVPDWTGNPAVSETDRLDKPPWVVGYNPPYGDTFTDVLGIRRQQLRTLMSVDDLVGAVSGELAKLGEDQDTLAFFLSDNGYMWGEHGLGTDKRFPYTQSVRIPFYLRWPGRVAAGATDSRLVANVDVAPTVLSAAGLSPDPGYAADGRSLLTSWVRDQLLLEYWKSPDGGPPGWGSIRTPAFQYIEWYADDGATLTFREYYDLVADPWQLENLLADTDPANDPDVASLSAALAMERCAGACRPARATSAEAFDAADARGKLDLVRLAYHRADLGSPLEITVETRAAWQPTLLKPSRRNRLVVHFDLDGDGQAEYRAQIVRIRKRLRAWMMGPDGRFGWVPATKPDPRTLTFVVPVGSPANPSVGGITLRARTVFFRSHSKCERACIDRVPDGAYAGKV